MKPGRTAAWVITATALPVLAACSGGTSSGNAPAGGTTTGGNQPATSAPASRRQSQSAAAATGADGLTPPGTHLAFGKNAIVGWVPQAEDGIGAHKGIKMQVTVESIQKGTLADFANVNLDAKEKKDTPYYVTLRLTELQNAPVPAGQRSRHHLHRDRRPRAGSGRASPSSGRSSGAMRCRRPRRS